MELGGDTDTNACIVGSMIGALIGVKALPKDLLGRVMQYDCTKEYKSQAKATPEKTVGHVRPEWLSVPSFAWEFT